MHIDPVVSADVYNRCIDVTFPLPPRPALLTGMFSLTCIDVLDDPILGVAVNVPIACGLSDEQFATVDSRDPQAIAAAMRADSCIARVS